MKRIYEYALTFNAVTEIQMPKNAEILTLQTSKKNHYPCIWALVDPSEEKESRVFELFETGQDICVDMGIDRKYIGTYQYQKGEFIGHVFERLS